ncbi:MAG: GNAT family N-acetyltransferase [Pseudomonadota bacterium]
MADLHAEAFPADAWDAASLLQLLPLPGVLAFHVLDETAKGNQAVGFLLARAAVDEAEVLTLVVAPPYRRLRVAQGLILALNRHLKHQSITRLFLEVAARNTAARAFYCYLGFHIIGERKGYYRSGDDALVMQLDLSSADPASSDKMR